MKNLLLLALISTSTLTLAQNKIGSASTGAGILDLSPLTGSSLGASIEKKDLPNIVKSDKVYCIKVSGKNYLASIGAMRIFKKTVTSRTKSVVCNNKVFRQAMLDGVDVIQLSKSKMTPDAYKTLGQGMTQAFGI